MYPEDEPYEYEPPEGMALEEDETSRPTVQDVLKERGSRYGSFAEQAEVSARIKKAMGLDYPAVRGKLDYAQTEALHMIAVKLARIVHGDPNYPDSWMDIAGYATLVHDLLIEEIPGQ